MCERACFVAWLTQLVRAERPRLAAIARREGLTDVESLDAVQDGLVTFVGLPAAWDAVGRDDDGARLLATVVRNAARNARRRHHRARAHDGDPEALAGDADVAALGDDAQRVVMMRLLDELGGDEVAEHLGTTPGNVAVMLHRAKARLRACLADAGVTPR
jgi:RNA polymerase sigma-70 factor (ECF subfamily)